MYLTKNGPHFWSRISFCPWKKFERGKYFTGKELQAWHEIRYSWDLARIKLAKQFGGKSEKRG